MKHIYEITLMCHPERKQMSTGHRGSYALVNSYQVSLKVHSQNDGSARILRLRLRMTLGKYVQN